MGKRGKSKGPKNPKKPKLNHQQDVDPNDMDDEIDAFYKKQDVVPLDVNEDVDSDEDDDEQAVFDYEGIDDDEDDEEDEEDEEADYDEYINEKGMSGKIAKQMQYLREKFGGVDDEMDEDPEENEKKRKVWSKGKRDYYGAENEDFELQSSDEETPGEELEEVIKLQRERAESLRAEDFGIQLEDSDDEPTMGEIVVKGKSASKSSHKEAKGEAAPLFEEVKKDLSSLSRDEQMAIVDSSAPELVGLLEELNDADDHLKTLDPLVEKVRKGDNPKKGGLHYLEVKQLLLRVYCQAITFYLLLKLERQLVRDHPVIARLVEIKSLLEKMKELDGYLPDGLEDALNEKDDIAPSQKPSTKHSAFSSDLDTLLNNLADHLADKQEVPKFREPAEPIDEIVEKKRRKKRDDPVSSESVKMLQYRAALEEKLKQRGVSGSVQSKMNRSEKQKHTTLSGQLETMDDFDDDTMDLEGNVRNNGRQFTLSSKVSKFITGQDKSGKKGISGDDDLPGRDDLGERRLKHELRVLAGAGVKSMDDDVEPEKDSGSSDEEDVAGSSESDGSENEFYKQVMHGRATKHAMKAQIYSWNQEVLYEPEPIADGKRHITTQMEKNRGLARPRKKLFKNPRKKNRIKYEKAREKVKGQVREIKKPTGSYGGETTGINTRVIRSVRFKG